MLLPPTTPKNAHTSCHIEPSSPSPSKLCHHVRQVVISSSGQAIWSPPAHCDSLHMTARSRSSHDLALTEAVAFPFAGAVVAGFFLGKYIIMYCHLHLPLFLIPPPFAAPLPPNDAPPEFTNGSRLSCVTSNRQLPTAVTKWLQTNGLCLHSHPFVLFCFYKSIIYINIYVYIYILKAPSLSTALNRCPCLWFGSSSFRRLSQ